MVRANSNWKIEFLSERWNIGSIDGVVQRFRISVVKTFGKGFDVCEVGRIDILGAGGIRPVFFMDVCRYRLFGRTVECFRLFVVQSTEIVSNKSRHWGRATKRLMFFCV